MFAQGPAARATSAHHGVRSGRAMRCSWQLQISHFWQSKTAHVGVCRAVCGAPTCWPGHQGRSVEGMHGSETRMLLKHYLERGVSKAELSSLFGVSRRTIHSWIEAGDLDRDLAAGETRYSPRPRRPHKLDAYKGIIDERLAEFPRLTAQRLFDQVRAAGYEGGYSRVRDQRPRGAAVRSGRADGALRDAAGAPGPGGLRHVHAAVGTPPRAGGCARPFAAAVAAVLSAADHGGADRGPGERVRALRPRAAGTAVRPDAARWCCRTTGRAAASWS